jgi:hypothetical protein
MLASVSSASVRPVDGATQSGSHTARTRPSTTYRPAASSRGLSVGAECRSRRAQSALRPEASRGGRVTIASAKHIVRRGACWAPELQSNSQSAVLVRAALVRTVLVGAIRVRRVLRASVGESPVQHSLVAILGGVLAHPPIPWAAIGTQPLQHSQVPILSCLSACGLILRAAIGTQPLQHSQMPASSCTSARPRIPRAAIGTQPMQHS